MIRRRILLAIIVIALGSAVAAQSAVAVRSDSTSGQLQHGDAVVRLGEAISTLRPSMAPIPVREERWDPTAVEHALGKGKLVSETLPEEVARSAGAQYLSASGDDGTLVTIPDAGAGFVYSKAVTATASIGRVTTETVQAMARDWIGSHGGMPSDAELYKIREVVEIPLDMDSRDGTQDGPGVTKRYYVQYRHYVDGVLVDSPTGGDELKVCVEPGGETSFYSRRWTTPIEGASGSRRQVIGAREALQNGLDQGALEMTKGASDDEFDLIDSRLVYLSASRATNVTMLRPCWRFVLHSDAGDLKVFVGAFDGKLVDQD